MRTIIIDKIPSDRKFKYLEQIDKTGEFKKLQYFINFSDSFFEIDEKTDSVVAFDTIKKYITHNTGNRNLEYLLIDVLNLMLHSLVIRPKSSKLIITLICMLVLNYRQESQIIFHAMFEHEYLSQYQFISNILTGQIFTRHIFDGSTDPPQNEISFSIYPDNSIQKIIMDDDINELIARCGNNDDFRSSRIYLTESSPLNVIVSKYNAKWTEFSAFYGSKQCFKYFEMNNFDFGVFITDCAIAGGSMDILHIVEQHNISFDYMFRISIMFRRLEISDWLLNNFSCEIFPIHLCFNYCDYRAFLFLLFNDFDVNKMNFESGYTFPLFSACLKCGIDTEIVRLLLEKTKNINKTGYANGYKTPLYAACDHFTLDYALVKLLVDKGADVNKISNGKTPLYMLASFSSPNSSTAIKYIIEKGADINQENSENKTAFYSLCKKESVTEEEIRMFIDLKAYVNAGYKTPLYALCCHSHPKIELIKYLVDNGADVNKECVVGNFTSTPLSALCKNENTSVEIVKFFIDHGADVNKGSITPLYSICSHNDLKDPSIKEIIKLLLNVGADPNKGDISPLYALCDHEHPDKELIQLLIQNGADVNKGSAFEPPLFTLCTHDEVDFELLKLFIESGADINRESSDVLGVKTKFSELCQQGKIKTALIDSILKTNDLLKINRRQTPLYALCQKEVVNNEVIKYFITKGADFTKGEQNFDGHTIETPLPAIIHNENIDIGVVDLLKEKGAKF